MKETVHANIGSQTFTIDQDAYKTLRNYLNDIQSRLPETDTESMVDIEFRIGEIFCEKLGAPKIRVVTIEMIREAMLQMGSPTDFGEPRDGNPVQPPSERRLYRSCTDRSIAGICGGLAQFFNIDTALVRLLTLALILFGGLSIWVYIILWIIIPEETIHPKSNTKTR